MRPKLSRILIPFACLLTILILQQASSAHDGNEVLGARASILETGQVVVSMETRGALPGLLTVTLAADAAGNVTGGSWALAVKYVQDLAPDGSPLPEGDHAALDESVPHAEYIEIVNRGTLTGHVGSGAVTIASDGSVLITNLQLTVQTGSLTFESVSSGYGSLDVDPRLAGAQGLLRLHF